MHLFIYPKNVFNLKLKPVILGMKCAFINKLNRFQIDDEYC